MLAFDSDFAQLLFEPAQRVGGEVRAPQLDEQVVDVIEWSIRFPQS
jgi:hypothetical protein